jgi:oligopeptide/dipeptide ABC transporter ATP-binding protein
MALVEVRNLTKVYPVGAGAFGRGKGEVRAVDGVSLDIEAGETLGLVGESGSGKSTLGRLILRLIEPTAGEVRFEGQDVLAAGGSELRRLRRDMQIIFQDPFASLDPRMTVEQILREPQIIHGKTAERRMGGSLPVGKKERRRSAEPGSAGQSGTAVSTQVFPSPTELLQEAGMDEAALRRYGHEFSGGQRQRIGIARALALRPRFLVADEPVSALDVSVGAQIVNLLAELQRRHGLTYLFISHSMPVVRYLATRIAVMYRGRILELGSTEQVTERPSHPYTSALLQAMPRLSAPGEKLHPIRGSVPVGVMPSGCHFHPRCDRAIDACRTGLIPVLQVGASRSRCIRAHELAEQQET